MQIRDSDIYPDDVKCPFCGYMTSDTGHFLSGGELPRCADCRDEHVEDARYTIRIGQWDLDRLEEDESAAEALAEVLTMSFPWAAKYPLTDLLEAIEDAILETMENDDD